MPRIHWTRRSSHTPEEENIDAAKFAELADGAKTNCPVSKVLAAAEITLDAKLV
jgi:osmotically inducible protein OsmC